MANMHLSVYCILLAVFSYSALDALVVRPSLKSCKEIKQKFPGSVSDVYKIDTNDGIIDVYCEMTINGGGYTFLPRSAIKTDTTLSLKNLFTDRTNVLVRLRNKDGRHPYAILEQIPKYSKVPLTVLINSHVNFPIPNNPQMGPYIQLGFIPSNIARYPSNRHQGFKINGRELNFRNCDLNPNSDFNLYPNHFEAKPISYHAGGVLDSWMTTFRYLPSGRRMPDEYFFFADSHFGGCGGYTSSEKWSNADGVALGFR